VLSTVVDDAAVRRLAIARDDVDVTLSVLRGREVSSYFVDDRLVPVVVALRAPLDAVDLLDHLYVRSASGSNVPLSAIAARTTERIAPTLFDEGQFPAVGARVHTTDVPGLKRSFTPPAGMVLLVYPD
jgi:multidrug efflux pump